MNEHQFNDLIRRYQQGKASSAEQRLLDEWLKQRSKGALFNQLSPEAKEMIGTNLWKHITEKQQRTNKPTRLIPLWARSTAAVILLSLLSYGIWKFINPEHSKQIAITTLYAHSSGPVHKVILSDGSIIWLKGNSTLTYPSVFSGKKRPVSLKGEALFEIAKDSLHPFVIQCDGLTATVRGTSFNIKTGIKKTEVLVLTGKVALNATHNQQNITVLPNEKAIYDNAANQIEKVSTAKIETILSMEGTEYDMFFNDNPLKEVIKKLEGKFNVKITLNDSVLESELFTANLTDQSLNNSLDILRSVLNINYEQKGDKITIYSH